MVLILKIAEKGVWLQWKMRLQRMERAPSEERSLQEIEER